MSIWCHPFFHSTFEQSTCWDLLCVEKLRTVINKKSVFDIHEALNFSRREIETINVANFSLFSYAPPPPCPLSCRMASIFGAKASSGGCDFNWRANSWPTALRLGRAAPRWRQGDRFFASRLQRREEEETEERRRGKRRSLPVSCHQQTSCFLLCNCCCSRFEVEWFFVLLLDMPVQYFFIRLKKRIVNFKGSTCTTYMTNHCLEEGKRLPTGAKHEENCGISLTESGSEVGARISFEKFTYCLLRVLHLKYL